jgi:hypothetical protein
MPIDVGSPLLELVRQTKCCALCEVEPEMFEVIDER